ncbi:hypothetical protein ACT7C8_01305 [Bacillus cereus]|uniref:Uncharacterized protein n=1 Tax=Bacillus cereus VD154 TaxID=1053238 RepID=A0A9W5NZI2_BACCE|nr:MULTISPECIES: hypothetical protein [Bacillus cereus group]MEB8734252.1 hypothetical protein [Bacillus cereus]EEM44671.1 hypothetical protein bthur0005_55250 [Bacillus thuringiensis serovar pakistani str. T13001]EJR63279.1 hypothetical protein IK5_05855 [Bacillus cereus VD154]MEB8752822.1 hypothetical protein [Bacillus cereus]MEB8761673.1 hypothetical protein [Bacillus cereus]
MVKSKTKLKKIIPVTMLLTATLTSAPLSSFAAEKNDVPNNYVSSQNATKAFQPTEESITFMSKVVGSGAIEEFNFSPDLKTMTYKHDMSTMKNTYNFNDEEIAKLEQIANFYNESVKNNSSAGLTNPNMNSTKKGGPQYVVTDYGWTWIKMTFTNAETKLLLAGAAAEGAYAMYAAFVGLSAITATPVGGAIISALALMGLPKFASICQTVLRALAAGKGVFIEIGMDGVIPYISASVARH